MRPPGPRGIEILIGLARFRQCGLMERLTQLHETHGDVLRIPIWPKPVVQVINPEFARHVLVTHRDRYGKGWVFRRLQPLLGNGLGTSEGDLWLRQRRMMQPAFTKSSVESLTSAMMAAEQRRIDEWGEAAASGEAIELASSTRRSTLRVITQTLFKTDLSEMEDDVLRSFDYALTTLLERLTQIVQFPLSVPTPSNRRLSEALRIVDEVVYSIIDRSQAGADESNLISRLLAARDPETGEGMSRTQLRDEVLTLLFAGFETTSCVLTWMWYEIARRPDIQTRMQQEIDSVVGSLEPEAADFEKLEYCRAVFLEALRLYPPAWALPREALVDDQIGGYDIKKGTFIVVLSLFIQRHPKYWPNPQEFDPDRFMGRDIPTPAEGFLPFGAGPRTCIGNHVAMLEAQINQVVTLQRFHLRDSDPTPALPDMSTTIQPDRKIFLEIQKR